MNNQQKIGAGIVGAGAIAGVYFLSTSEEKKKSVFGGGNGGFTETKKAVGSDNITNITNEYSIPAFNPTSTSKTSSSSKKKSSSIDATQGNYQDAVSYNTKKGTATTTDAVRFPISTSPSTGAITVPTYGIGYGGTDTTLGVPIKKETAPATGGFFSGWFS